MNPNLQQLQPYPFERLRQLFTGIEPAAGKILMFQHPIIHEGSLVTAGIKYVARTDLMYRKSGT